MTEGTPNLGNVDSTVLREQIRKELAKKNGLPEDTPQEEIDKYRHEKIRESSAINLGLPANASWEEIDKKRGTFKKVSNEKNK